MNDIGGEAAKALGPALGKLLNMHTLDLTSGCCGLAVGVYARRHVAHVFDRGVVHEQTMTSVPKERRRWVQRWASC